MTSPLFPNLYDQYKESKIWSYKIITTRPNKQQHSTQFPLIYRKILLTFAEKKSAFVNSVIFYSSYTVKKFADLKILAYIKDLY